MSFFVYYIMPFIVVLGILIFFHELGHFMTAKLFGVKVLKFALGFGPRLAAKTVGETEYSIRIFPLGGFVKMLGENEDEDEDPLPPEDEERSFNSQHVLKRIAIVGAGPLFNLFLALSIFCGFYMASGKDIMVPEIGQIRDDSPAQQAGFLKGDMIHTIAGKPVVGWSEIKDIIQANAEGSIEITVMRGEELITRTLIPEISPVKNIFGEEVKTALIGIVASGRYDKISLGPVGAIEEGFKNTWKIVELTFVVIVKLFQGVVPLKTVGGPILIGQMTGEIAKQDWTYLIPFTAAISINLGILNLLPIPILDGGFIVFLLIELVMRRPLSFKKREWAMKIGLFLLITLMIVVTYNDIARFDFHKIFDKLFG